MKNNNNAKSMVLSIVIPLVLSILVTMVFLLSVGKPVMAVFEGMIGTLSQPENIGYWLVTVSPLIFTGVAVALAYRSGLFNIGVEGQFIFGSTLGLYAALKLETMMPSAVSFVLALLAGMLGGALIAAIPGILKAVFKVNEVVVSIMMNYVAMYFAGWIVISQLGRSDDPSRSETAVKTVEFMNSFSIGGINILVIALAVLLLVGYYVLISKTTFGYELRASGLNGNAARYAGMNVERNVILSMIISGAIAGAGGVIYILSTTGFVSQLSQFTGNGFTGIAVALLGQSTPIGVAMSGLLFGLLNASSVTMPFGVSKDILAIAIALIVLFISAQPKIKTYFNTKFALKAEKGVVKNG